MTMPLSGMVCWPWPRTCYDQPTCRILNFLSPPIMKICKVIQNLEN